MSEHTPLTEAERIEQAIYDIAVDHPMWIGDDGQSLDYLPEREARIADFVREVADACAQALAAGFVRPEDVAEAQMRVAALLCERHQQASPTRQPCAACMQDAAAALRPVDAPEGGA